jgi:two-component system cell cycle sensor histidine kinase/response regulator CckA
MKPEVLSRIFDPFFTTKEVGKGTGLGLPTVQTIVRSHGGFINVVSEVNRGTEFKVYLPAEEHALPQKQESGPPPIPRGNGELILVADDEASIRQVTRTTLREQGYEVITASDGVEALTLFTRHKHEVKLIVTDIMMPAMDGAALIQSLLKVDPHINVIAVSGLLDSEGHYSIPESSTIVSLQKPFTAERLLLMIHDRLHRSDTPSFL